MSSSNREAIFICETYMSLQGEGEHAGLPCFFIRTAGCDLRCSWCDTTHSFGPGQAVAINNLVDQLPQSAPLVQITGGEPALQKRLPELFAALHLRHPATKILLETGGHRSLQAVPDYVHIVMDIKLPSSGEENHAFQDNFRYLKKSDEIKFIIADEGDYLQAKKWMSEYRLAELCKLLFSPAWGRIEASQLAEWILADGIPVRLQMQLHKIIWGPGARLV